MSFLKKFTKEIDGLKDKFLGEDDKDKKIEGHSGGSVSPATSSELPMLEAISISI
jgi:hypothetical protein